MTAKAQPKAHKETPFDKLRTQPYPTTYGIFREGKYRAARKHLNMSLRLLALEDISKSKEKCECPLSWHVKHYKLQFTHKPDSPTDREKEVVMCPILIALGRQRLYFHRAAEDDLDVGELIRMAK